MRKQAAFFIGGLILLFMGGVFAGGIRPPTSVLAAEKTPHPGWQLLFQGTLAMDENWIAQHPDDDHVHQEVTIPGPGYIYTYDYYSCRRLDDPQGWCGYGGGYTITLYDSGGRVKEFWQWVDGGVAHLDVWECLSTGGLDPYPYACDIEVYWDPDSDLDYIPDSRDQCPFTPSGQTYAGEPYGPEGDGCPPPTQPPTPTPFPTATLYSGCEIELYVSPENLGPGETAYLDLRAFRDGAPIAGDTAQVYVVSGSGTVLDGPYLTDEYGEAEFLYHAPADIAGSETVQLMGTVAGCPDDYATAYLYLQSSMPVTPTATPALLPTATQPPAPTPLPEGSLELVVAETNDAGQPYTAIAADEVSRLRLEARLSGTLKPDDVVWEISAAGVENPGSLEVVYSSTPAVSTREFVPPIVFVQPFTVRITARVQTAAGEVSDSVDIQVVRPPVVLIHGIWSNKRAMLPIRAYLLRTGQFRGVFTADYGTPPKVSHQDMRLSVRYLAAEVERALRDFRSSRIKVSRLDIVAHSMGGLISRLYIVGDGQTLQAHPDVVRKLITLDTPHGGSILADWYTDLMDEGSVACSSPADYVPEKVTRNEIAWLMDVIRAVEKMDSTALQFGDAVRQLQTRGRPGSIVDTLYSRHLQVDEATSYNVIVGRSPLGGEIAKIAAGAGAKYLHKNYYEVWLVAAGRNSCGEKWRPAVELMVTDFLERVTASGSDGVVSEASMAAQGTGIIPETVDYVYSANHFSVTSNGMALFYVLSSLTYGQARQAVGSFIVSHSPGHLHVYTDDNRHVGMTTSGQAEVGIEGAVYETFADAMGEHELIWVPGDLDLNVWFMADQDGWVGLDISRSAADGLHWYAYDDIEVQAGDQVGVRVEDVGTTGRVNKSSGESLSLSPSSAEVLGSGSGDGAGGEALGGVNPLVNYWLLALCCLVSSGAGAGVLWLLSRRRPALKGAAVALTAFVVVLLLAVCCLTFLAFR